jgi:hypothetical protein
MTWSLRPLAPEKSKSPHATLSVDLFAMTNEERRAFIRILIHYCPDECKHFAECEFPKDHIFRDLMVLAQYIHEQSTED